MLEISKRINRFGEEDSASDLPSLSLTGMGYTQGQKYRFLEGT